MLKFLLGYIIGAIIVNSVFGLLFINFDIIQLICLFIMCVATFYIVESERKLKWKNRNTK